MSRRRGRRRRRDRGGDASRVPAFADVAALRGWLVSMGVGMSDYDSGRTKPLSSLLSEIEAGETVLAVRDGVVVRRVSVVTATVTHGGLVLREARQVMADGREWRRDLGGDSMAEKMARGETPAEAISRAMGEELDRDDGQYEVSGPVRKETEEKTSFAYPGITSRLTLYRMEVEVLESGYVPEGYVEVQEDKSTYFEWRPQSRGRGRA